MRTQQSRQHQKFTIAIRIRPTIKEDALSYKESEMEDSLQNESTSVLIRRKHNEEKRFRFNEVLSPGSQREVYSISSHLTECLFDGYNGTFLAYGQTGTGKTYTVFGNDKEEVGYFSLVVEDLFSRIKKRLNERQFAVRVSFAEFYLDNIYDLLEGGNRRLDIKENSQEGVHIRDLTQVSVRSAEQLMACMKRAIKARKTEETGAQNKRSSRSHAVIQITLMQRWKAGDDKNFLKAMLKIVDLAGSERVSKTESNGSRLEQAKRINKEITTLGKCINLLAMAQKQNKVLSSQANRFNLNRAYIPFRDSKITRYLSEALQGKAKITLCVCISKFMVHLQESFSSLMFATQASTLKVDSIRNEVYTMQSMKRSVEKQRNETPMRRTDIKNRYSQRETRSVSESAGERGGVGWPKPPSQPVDPAVGSRLLEKFSRQWKEITQFLDKKEIDTKAQSRETLQSNLQAMHKIFSLMRDSSSLPTFY